MDAVLSVVAGCLFEVSLPGDAAAGWRWANPTPEVTVLAEHTGRGAHHFRFRAEAGGAAAGSVLLRFARRDGREADVVVHVAPEHLPATEAEDSSTVGR